MTPELIEKAFRVWEGRTASDDEIKDWEREAFRAGVDLSLAEIARLTGDVAALREQLANSHREWRREITARDEAVNAAREARALLDQQQGFAAGGERERLLREALTIIATGKPAAAPSVDWQCLRCTSVIETAASALAATQEEAGAGEPPLTMATHPWSPREFSELWTPYEGRPKVFVRIECEFCRLPEVQHPASAPPAPRPGEQEADHS